jgi:4-amino-4-deoxy-L-arabinose transferase-like glycosyltransferase
MGIVLAVTTFNLTYRLDRETITEWDESLYATSAWEMLQTGDWVSTRFLGQIDYYNAKPPLNVWLIALAFKTFGVSPASLRLTSVACAWLTVALLMLWVRKIRGDLTAVLAGLVLTTCFAFVYVHSARTANTDALFTLLMLLVVITIERAGERPWARAWLGPILAMIFLLRGTAVLMPLAIIIATARTLRGRPHAPRTAWPTIAAVLGFLVPTMTWAIARWRVDEWQFFDKLWGYDLVSRSFVALEGHGGGVFYYLDVLQKYQYDWLVAAAAAVLLRPPSAATLRRWLLFWRLEDRALVLVGWWAAMTLLIPTVMMTKVSWYLDPFYPVFALIVASLIARVSKADDDHSAADWRGVVMIVTVVVASGAAEGRLLWHSVHNRTMRGSAQELLQAERPVLAGQTVYRDRWTHADRFVLVAMVGGHPAVAGGVDAFLGASRSSDYFLGVAGLADSRLVPVRSVGRHTIYRRAP